ncbi:MAG: dockerin type I repeat-containing protein [Oscillospiraceae bacterium]|nr:dockerin type I repeat-containing protein [Oscillospiraceae bacterium]
MKKQHITTALTSAVCLLACSVSAAAALTVHADNSPAEPEVTTYVSTSEPEIFCNTGMSDFPYGEIPEDVTNVTTTEEDHYVRCTEDCCDGSGSLPVENLTDPYGGTDHCVITTPTTVTTLNDSYDDYSDYIDTAHDWMGYNRIVLEQLPSKLYYCLGEELDLTGALISGDGDSHFYMEPLTDHMDMVDASEFDSSKFGKYTIYIHGRKDRVPFEVYVDGGSGGTTITKESETYDTETTIITTVKNTHLHNTPGSGCEDYYYDITPGTDPLTLSAKPDKTVYRIGEELDLTGAALCGDYDRKLKDTPLIEQMDMVDASAFDNTKPGAYWISVTGEKDTIGFYVYVVEGDPGTFVEPEEIEITTTTAVQKTAQGSISIQAPDKTVYFVGESLDLTGGMFSGGGAVYIGNMPEMHYDWFNCKLTDYENMVDASAFDNTKPGTYTISVVDPYGISASFNVRVIPALTEESGDVNGDKNVTVADAVILARVAAEDTAVTITEDGKKYGDIDQDGSLTLDDLTYVLKIIADLI